MARQLTPFGKIVVMTAKWVLLPLLLALVGYKIIGPMIAGPAAEAKEVTKPKRITPQSETGRKFQSVREGNG